MPMPINNLDEYDKVVNVSWYKPEKEREDLVYVVTFPANYSTEVIKISLCTSLFADVSTLLHRYSRFPQPILLLFRRLFSTSKYH